MIGGPRDLGNSELSDGEISDGSWCIGTCDIHVRHKRDTGVRPSRGMELRGLELRELVAYLIYRFDEVTSSDRSRKDYLDLVDAILMVILLTHVLVEL